MLYVTYTHMPEAADGELYPKILTGPSRPRLPALPLPPPLPTQPARPPAPPSACTGVWSGVGCKTTFTGVSVTLAKIQQFLDCVGECWGREGGYINII